MQESLTSFEGYTDEDANGLCEVISAFLRGGGSGGGGGGHLMQGEGGWKNGGGRVIKQTSEEI